MTDVPEIDSPVDGRAARRQRNIDVVLDVVIEMFAEEAMFPTIDQVATRSGLSLRSLYRYFADPGELLDAAIRRTGATGREISSLHAIGEGPLDARIEDFVAMRLRLYEFVGPVFRAGAANAVRHPRIREQLSEDRIAMRQQFEIQFAPELAARTGSSRESARAAGDLLTQLEAIDFLRRHRQLSVAESHAVLAESLQALLG